MNFGVKGSNQMLFMPENSDSIPSTNQELQVPEVEDSRPNQQCQLS